MAKAVAETRVPSWWRSREEQIQRYLDTEIRKGIAETIAVSPGGRRVRSVSYGEAEPGLKGPANFNSAVAAGDEAAYFKRGHGMRKRPVLVILAGVHGGEVEGVMGAMSLINMMETGRDIRGIECPGLYEKLQKLRLTVIPLANPDGRARIGYDSWCGADSEIWQKFSVGTRKSGETSYWPYCKSVHPMKGDVGILGGYFDDLGVNMMHDEWSEPMSPVTKAVMKLVREEGPDMVMDLHGHGNDACILPLNFVPYRTKLKLKDFTIGYYDRLKKAGFTFEATQLFIEDDPCSDSMPSFNLDSMLYHTGAGLCFTHESPQGVDSNPVRYGCDDLLDIHHILFETAADSLLA